MVIKLTLIQVLSQPVVPFAFFISFSTLVGFFFYCIKSGFAKTEKQISWILTLASSFVCTFVSIPYFIMFWKSGWDMSRLSTDSFIHTTITCFFISYLALDLLLGSVYYRNRITILTGWIHHPLYICILFWLLRWRSASFFTANCLLELPTLILALGSMRGNLRCDILFAFTFFILRLVFHASMIVALKKSHRLEILWLVAIVVFPLHLYWFYGIITQLIKKYTTHIHLLRSSTSSSTSRQTIKRSKYAFLDKIYTI